MKRDYSQLFAILKKHRLEYKDVVAEFTDGRTDSLKALTDGEFRELMIRMQRYNAPPTDAANQMRRKMIAIARQMRWTKPDPNPLRRGEEVADMERIDNWCIKYGKFNKKLNAHTYDELTQLITAFEHVLTSYLSSLQKT